MNYLCVDIYLWITNPKISDIVWVLDFLSGRVKISLT